MEYYKREDPRFSVRVDAKSPYEGRLSEIRSLVSQAGYEEVTTTNRRMWPDEEVVGVRRDSEDVTIIIKPSEVELRVEGIDNIVEAHRELSSDLEPCPSFSQFGVARLSIRSEDEEVFVDIDRSKCIEQDRIMGCKFTYSGHNYWYQSVGDFVSFISRGESVPVGEASGILDHVVESQIIVTGKI